MDDVPHLALPIRLEGGVYVAVQQDTLDEVRTTVAAIVAFPVGTRIEAPWFGVPELELTVDPVDVETLRETIIESEPRPAISVVELPPDVHDPGAARVRIEVALPGETEDVI